MRSLKLLLFLTPIFLLAFSSSAQEYDFFYFVQQWPRSFCNTNQGCCYPTYGKPPSDFGIHGLWPNYNNSSYPTYCDPNNTFDINEVQGLVFSLRAKWPSLKCPRSDSSRFWQLQWMKHGTCSVLSQSDYFSAALQLKAVTNILQCLQLAGIWPDDRRYTTLTSVVSAIQNCVGHTIYVQCNRDIRGRHQLYQVYICVNQTGTGLIDCPVFPTRTCPSSFRFPKF
ncbi:hypothetical protein LUZ63_017631 [Rhynchospora breviuscula]|uniref:Uncharacterized protein n=1 Tax=Rhynchospora breviuscula TaxID=2022672 RepID=A0A9Q0C2V2_9POAL|nr:hypothetical protein LUZ63_017631 [Rhynchospora breviuscula]